jgi:uncharacterized protein DUF2490
MRIALSVLLFVLSFSAFSQQSDLGSWSVINTRLDLTTKWSVFNELQLRSQSFYHNFYYYEIKGGVSYSIDKNFSVLVGGGKYMTYSDSGNFKDPVTSNEWRTWEQITMKHHLERIKFEHRYRIEQRWFKNNDYRNRFRYRLSAAVPLNSKTFEPKTFYVSLFNEVFFSDNEPYFERNRFFAGAGYQVSKHFTVQPGWVYQYDYRNGKGRGKNFFQLTLMIELDAKNPNKKIPGTED